MHNCKYRERVTYCLIYQIIVIGYSSFDREFYEISKDV